MKSAYLERIVRDPRVCGGQPIFYGTRVRLKVVLDNLAEGHTESEILAAYPTLRPEDVHAAIAFAAAAAADDFTLPMSETLSAV